MTTEQVNEILQQYGIEPIVSSLEYSLLEQLMELPDNQLAQLMDDLTLGSVFPPKDAVEEELF